MHQHGNRNVVAYVVVAEQDFKIEVSYRFVFKNHFRIIPADVPEEQKSCIHKQGYENSYRQDAVFFDGVN